MPSVSIIVPIYNSEKYLAECITSIINQSFTDIEIILVNDGSTDRSLSICNVFLKRDSRIKLINQINQGASQARSTGVKNAKGEWVTFVDSDDTIPNNSIMDLFNLTSQKTDIIIGLLQNYKILWTSHISINNYRKLAIKGVLVSSPCGKLYRKSIFNDLTFDIPDKIKTGEDVIMNIRLSFNTQNDVIILKKKIYNYRNNLNSISHRESLTIDNIYLRQIEHLKTLPLNLKNKYIPQFITDSLNILIPYYIKNYYTKEKIITDNAFQDLNKKHDMCSYKIAIIDYLILKYPNIYLFKTLLFLRQLYNRITNKLGITIYAQTH